MHNDLLRKYWPGLLIALFAMPLLIGLYTSLDVPLTAPYVVLRELMLFGFAIVLLVLVRKREGLDWRSIGLQRPSPGKTALWVLITFVGIALAAALAFGLIKLFGWHSSTSDASYFDTLPVPVLCLVILRAGFVEELFYRGYAMERLEALTGNRVVAFIAPLLLFAVFHYRQGMSGILIAFLMGAVLAGVYVYTRNLWVTITTHFLGDFIPNIVLPLFDGAGGQ